MLDGVSLDQLRTFIAAVDEGSFSAAARKLNRVQSAVSGWVGGLEDQIGVVLFDRTGRFPKLTAEGVLLLADARNIVSGVDTLKARAKLMASGLETELSVVVDVFFPTALVSAAAKAFARQFPLTPLRKIGIGLFLTGLSFVVIVWVQGQIDSGLRPSINWQLLAYVILTLGEAMVSITGLEFSYTQAPNTMKSSVMALWLLTVASGELFVGLFNKWMLNPDGTRKLNDYQYFMFFTVLMFATAVVFVVVSCFYKGRTYLQTQQLTPDEIATEPILHGGTPS